MNELDAALEPAARVVSRLVDTGVSAQVLEVMLRRGDVRTEMNAFWWTDYQKKQLSAAAKAIGWEIHWMRWEGGHGWDIVKWETI